MVCGGNFSTNFQVAGRELLTPDEVRMLDNRFADGAFRMEGEFRKENTPSPSLCAKLMRGGVPQETLQRFMKGGGA